MDQLLATVFGNLLTVGLGLVVWVVKNKCNHCESECNMPCCHIGARDHTMRGTSHPPVSGETEYNHSRENSPEHHRAPHIEGSLSNERIIQIPLATTHARVHEM
jgi:hypothetical protein